MYVTATGRCPKCNLRWQTVGGDGQPLDKEVHFIQDGEMIDKPCSDCVTVFGAGESFA